MEHKKPTGIIFLNDTLIRNGVNGDNWSITWADDGHQYTSQDDGRGWQTEKDFNTRIWRIKGSSRPTGPDPFTPEYLPGFPDYLSRGGWYGYGIDCVDGVLYHFITRAIRNEWSVPFTGAKLIYSPDHGKTWLRHDGGTAWEAPYAVTPETMFFWKEAEDWAFSQIEFVQFGQNNSLAKDEYVYLYSPNGKKPHELNLARAPKGDILNRSSYRYFVGYTSDQQPIWTEKEDIRMRGVVHRFPDNWGLYSWLPSVVYNQPLDLFIMTTGGTERTGDRWMHDHTGSLGFYWSKHAWGPWNEFYYTENWYADSEENLCYQPKLSSKWISEDGLDMVLIFSDAQKNELGFFYTVNYRWNQIQIHLDLE